MVCDHSCQCVDCINLCDNCVVICTMGFESHNKNLFCNNQEHELLVDGDTMIPAGIKLGNNQAGSVYTVGIGANSSEVFGDRFHLPNQIGYTFKIDKDPNFGESKNMIPASSYHTARPLARCIARRQTKNKIQ